MAKLTRAYLMAGGETFHFPVNPYTANWGYQENAVSRDTLGGRVVQLLSVQVTELTVTSVAGSRRELQRVASSIQRIMNWHITSLMPATFVVPSRKWSFKVYITAMPQMGWEVASTSYPYQLTMAIDEDVSGIKTKQVLGASLSRLYEGIGYSKEVHGGDPRGFSKTVKSVLAAAALGGVSTTTTTTGSGGGSIDAPPGSSGVDANKDSLSFDEVARLSAWALALEIPNMSGSDLRKNAIYATAVSMQESGHHVGSQNPNATNGTAIGLWQASASQNGFSIQQLQTAEGNARWMAVELKADYDLGQNDNPYPIRTWEHAWWAYWGAFRSGAYQQYMNEATTAVGNL